jgi:hypothetical protein
MKKEYLKFQNAQHLTSWLKLAPNNKISGGINTVAGHQKLVID